LFIIRIRIYSFKKIFHKLLWTVQKGSIRKITVIKLTT